jgi:UDP-N-acetylglucosamine 4,6-dehydratase
MSKNFFNNKSILITGGTGSFGKAFVKKILSSNIRKIIIFSRDEYKQFLMKKEFSNKELNKMRFFLGDIRDKERINLALNNVDIVVHAAALKQVDVAEYNPQEFVKTNIVGAHNLIQCCLKSNVKQLIALSTDKAVNPINLYGATKLVSDKLFVSANNLVGNKKLSFSVVRYGNVVNSRGSLIQVLLELGKDKKAIIPITDLEMTRFWITLEQSVKFVEKCLGLMQGGEIFIPKLPSIKIIDLIKALCPLNKIKIIGKRPGEKINEVLFSRESSSETIEFKENYLSFPTIKLNKKVNYFLLKNREKGKLVKKNFEYSSNTNHNFLNAEAIKKLILKGTVN